MADYQTPYEKLHLFVEKIGISAGEMEELERFRPVFIEKRDEFAGYFYDVFSGIPDTRALIEAEKEPGLMKRVWSNWFGSFFKSKLNDDFLAYLWRIGVRHVEVSLDQRFSNLGFAVIRQFCHSVILAEAPLDQRGALLSTVDKLVDLCLLIETSAYIENTIHCDIEVMREVADRVRNPAMIIGWNIKKLHDKVSLDTKEHKVYDMLMAENSRLENMVHDIKVYMEMFQGEPQFQRVELTRLVAAVMERLQKEGKAENIRADVDIGEEARYVQGDPQWIEYLLYYLLQNSMEAASKENPDIRISSRRENIPPFSLRIEIFNSGNPPREEEQKLFSPFFSTKPTGTGFGLPIARLVVKKHRGVLSIQPADGQGTILVIRLPAPD